MYQKENEMLTIIRGLPGSGKSTLAKRIQQEFNISYIYEADDYFMVDGVYKFDYNKLKEAHDQCYNNVREALASGYEVIVANTFVKQWEMARYKALGPYEVITAEGRVVRGEMAQLLRESAEGLNY